VIKKLQNVKDDNFKSFPHEEMSNIKKLTLITVHTGLKMSMTQRILKWQL
jgi:hypothetical protein